jgi:hypothetical protein
MHILPNYWNFQRLQTVVLFRNFGLQVLLKTYLESQNEKA